MGSSCTSPASCCKLETGTQMLHVPYKGSAPALNGVLGGETQFMIDSVGSSIPLIKGGKLRAMAVTSAQRLPALPEVPTVAESACPASRSAPGSACWCRADAGRHREPAQCGGGAAMRDQAFRAQFEAVGLVVPAPIESATFARFIQAEAAKWGPLIKAKNITLE